MNIGITLPYSTPDGRLFKSSTTTFEQTKINIINLLSTEVGERKMQPTFGVGFKKYLFEPNILELSSLISADISTAIETWLPHVIIDDINVSGQLDESLNFGHRLKISLRFTTTVTPEIFDSIELTINP